MKRTLGALLPVILFIAFSCWMYDAMFVRRTQIVLRNASATQLDSVDFRVEWAVLEEEYPFDSIGLGSAHHYFGRMEPGQWKAIDMDVPIGLPMVSIVYRAGETRYGHHAREFSAGTALTPMEIDLKAEADSALDVRAGEGAP